MDEQGVLWLRAPVSTLPGDICGLRCALRVLLVLLYHRCTGSCWWPHRLLWCWLVV